MGDPQGETPEGDIRDAFPRLPRGVTLRMRRAAALSLVEAR